MMAAGLGTALRMRETWARVSGQVLLVLLVHGLGAMRTDCVIEPAC